MFKIGLCSVTFRQLSVEEIIQLSVDTNIRGIEWGGDVHVPVGDLARAKEVGEQTVAAGLEPASYGSYYRVGEYEKNPHSFAEVLATTVSLGARQVRIWAGVSGSEAADKAYREQVVSETREIATIAQQQKVRIHVEYHGGTLTDTKESAAQFFKEVDHPNVSAYWQPAVGEKVENRLETIKLLQPWLSDVHVFYWDITKRLPLANGQAEWKRYLDRLTSKEKSRYLYLEFVQDDQVEQFKEDVKTLEQLIDTFGQ